MMAINEPISNAPKKLRIFLVSATLNPRNLASTGRVIKPTIMSVVTNTI
jgi:hypothetical protein